MEINGRKYDDYILAGQEMKLKINQLTSKSHNTVEEYCKILEEIGIIDSQIDIIQNNDNSCIWSIFYIGLLFILVGNIDTNNYKCIYLLKIECSNKEGKTKLVLSF